MSLPSICMIGLGLMGGAMAANLVGVGHQVIGIDPSPPAQKEAASRGVEVVNSVEDIPRGTRLVFTSLPSGAALLNVASALARTLPAGAIVAELSTLSMADKEQARRTLASANVVLLDAPISGTGAQAKERDLSIYVSGDEAAWNELAPVFLGLARRPMYVGEFGAGMRLKFIANLLVAIHNVAAAEAMAMAEASGIDMETAVEVLRTGAGNSRMFELRAPMMARRTYKPPTMKLDVWQKDMELIAAYARERGLNTPLFDATQSVYRAALLRSGLEDTAAVFEEIRSSSGVGRS